MFCLTSSPWSFKMDPPRGRIIVRATLGSEMRPRFAKIGGHSLLQTVNRFRNSGIIFSREMSQKHTSVQIKTDIYQNVPLNYMNQGSISKSATVECGSSIASHQIEWGCLREIYCQHEAKHLEHQSMNIPSQKNRKRSKYIQYIQVRSFPCFPDLHFEGQYKKGDALRSHYERRFKKVVH